MSKPMFKHKFVDWALERAQTEFEEIETYQGVDWKIQTKVYAGHLKKGVMKLRKEIPSGSWWETKNGVERILTIEWIGKYCGETGKVKIAEKTIKAMMPHR